MDRHGVVQVALGDTFFQGNGEALQDFICPFAQQVDAHHALVFAHADQLEQAALRRVDESAKACSIGRKRVV